MSGNLYKFTIEQLDESKTKVVESAPLIFEAQTHEDLFRIVEMMKSKVDLDEADATKFAVGLKLFAEVMLNNKDHALFQQFKPHFREFMQQLKKA